MGQTVLGCIGTFTAHMAQQARMSPAEAAQEAQQHKAIFTDLLGKVMISYPTSAAQLYHGIPLAMLVSMPSLLNMVGAARLPPVPDAAALGAAAQPACVGAHASAGSALRQDPVSRLASRWGPCCAPVLRCSGRAALATLARGLAQGLALPDMSGGGGSGAAAAAAAAAKQADGAAQVRGPSRAGQQQLPAAAVISHASILGAALRALASAATALLLPALFGLLRVTISRKPMVWFASQWVACCCYTPLALLGALLPWLSKSNGRARSAPDAHVSLGNSILGCSLLLAAAGAGLSRLGAGSSFMCAWPAASGAATGALVAAWGLHWGSLLAAMALGAVPLLAGTEVRGPRAAGRLPAPAACCMCRLPTAASADACPGPGPPGAQGLVLLRSVPWGWGRIRPAARGHGPCLAPALRPAGRRCVRCDPAAPRPGRR
jgi:hypothetical protein